MRSYILAGALAALAAADSPSSTTESTSTTLTTSTSTSTSTGSSTSNTAFSYFKPSWSLDFPFPGSPTSTGASLAGIAYQTATYHVGCVSGANSDDCDIATSWTIIESPETVSFTGAYKSDGTTVTKSYECKMTSSTVSPTCTMSVEVASESHHHGKNKKKSTSTSTSTSYGTVSTTDSNYWEALSVTAGLGSTTNSVAYATGTQTSTSSSSTSTGAAATGNVGALITGAPLVAAAVVALL